MTTAMHEKHLRLADTHVAVAKVVHPKLDSLRGCCLRIARKVPDRNARLLATRDMTVMTTF